MPHTIYTFPVVLLHNQADAYCAKSKTEFSTPLHCAFDTSVSAVDCFHWPPSFIMALGSSTDIGRLLDFTATTKKHLQKQQGFSQLKRNLLQLSRVAVYI